MMQKTQKGCSLVYWKKLPFYTSQTLFLMLSSNNMKNLLQLFLLFTALLTTSVSAAQENNTPFNDLVWSDEFTRDGALDASKWHHQTQIPTSGGWYNGEIQHYTNRPDNSFTEEGILRIVAKRETFTDQGLTRNYTSARLNSKFAFRYGRVEIRAKMPFGVGTWPALWMLGKNINEDGGYWDTQGFGTTVWPNCGEIDIIEHWGDNQNFVQSAIHTPSSFGGTVNKGGVTLSTASDDFHVYTLDWYENRLVFGIDGVTHYTYQPAFRDASTWPFFEEQYILFNVAILPNIQAGFTESAMEVDYIRIYQEAEEEEEEEEENEEVITSLEEVETNAELYPNPVNDVLTIAFPDGVNKNLSIEIFEVSGAKVIGLDPDIEVKGDQVIISNLASLSSGIYLIRYKSDQLEGNARFVKR